MKDDWCKHYNGVGNSSTCKVGVAYDTVRDTSQKPFRWCCIHADAKTECALREEYTPEEIAEQQRQIAAVFVRMAAFLDGEGDECPHCGAKIESAEQVGRCVYARPCGCRVVQGKLPERWKK